MAKSLKQMLEVYKPKAGDEQKFVDKHIVSKTEDANGNKDDVFQATNVKKVDRKKENHGYDTGEDEKVYESVDQDEEDIVTTLLELYAECDDEERQELINIIESGEIDSFFEHLAEEIEREVNNG